MKVNDCQQEIKRLKQHIIELQEQLASRDECLNKALSKNKANHQETQQNNDLYAHYKICQANWSTIPAGIAYRSDINIASFDMLSTAVTFDMYDLYCADTHQQPPNDEGWGRANRPVINVNYHNALDYAHWLSEQTGWHCQLPTEEQWEYACRAKTITHYWYGDNPDPRMMVMGTGKTMPTPGHRLANPWDLYDMHGNVWEWTSSFKGEDVILCGGSWYNKANWLSSTARNRSYPRFYHNNWGFRLIRINK